MFRISQFECRPGREPSRLENLPEIVKDRKDAISLVERYIKSYEHHGYDAEQDYWWGRNDSDETITRFTIEATP
jgi:hypothetical protein